MIIAKTTALVEAMGSLGGSMGGCGQVNLANVRDSDPLFTGHREGNQTDAGPDS